MPTASPALVKGSSAAFPSDSPAATAAAASAVANDDRSAAAPAVSPSSASSMPTALTGAPPASSTSGNVSAAAIAAAGRLTAVAASLQEQLSRQGGPDRELCQALLDLISVAQGLGSSAPALARQVSAPPAPAPPPTPAPPFFFQPLNEVIVQRGLAPSMASLQVFVDGSLVTTVRADGLIVSTPTGSTGYSMSAGGPMVAPSTPAIIVTPVCPHNLSFRPLVVCDSSLLRIRVHPDMAPDLPLFATFDGRAPVRPRLDRSLDMHVLPGFILPYLTCHSPSSTRLPLPPRRRCTRATQCASACRPCASPPS